MIEPTSTSPGDKPVTLREFEAYQKAVAKETTLRWQLFDQYKDSSEESLRLQAREYERRLEDLNNSHEKAIAVQNTYVSKEALRLEMDDLRRRVESNAASSANGALERVRLTATIAEVATDVSALVTSQTWITKLVIGAVIAGLLALVLGGNKVVIGG